MPLEVNSTAMTDSPQGRMLLSHNFDIADDTIPPLSRADFVAVFRDGLHHLSQIHCRAIEHPHWIVEVVFPTPKISPQQMGIYLAQALLAKRQGQIGNILLQNILILGGIKTTPPTSTSPNALQPGEWGVDVVETLSVEQFLDRIGWEATVSQRSPDTVFKVELTSTDS